MRWLAGCTEGEESLNCLRGDGNLSTAPFMGGFGAWLRCDFACLLFCCSLSVEDAHTEPQGQRKIFRAHFNIWWARRGWPLIHLVSRLDGLFSRPPYLTAAVNLTAGSAIEPPRGGEHGAGVYLLNRKRPFAESRS